MPYCNMVNVVTGNSLLPDSTKPLPEPRLTSHLWGSVAFAQSKFLQGVAKLLILHDEFEDYIFKIIDISPRCQWVKALPWLGAIVICQRLFIIVSGDGYLFPGFLIYWLLNSLAPGKFKWNFRHVIFKQILVIDGWGISCEIAQLWMSLDFTDDQSTLVQVMAWCHQATSHYLSQCWPRSLSPYGITRPNELIYWGWVTHICISILRHHSNHFTNL